MHRNNSLSELRFNIDREIDNISFLLNHVHGTDFNKVDSSLKRFKCDCAAFCRLVRNAKYYHFRHLTAAQ